MWPRLGCGTGMGNSDMLRGGNGVSRPNPTPLPTLYLNAKSWVQNFCTFVLGFFLFSQLKHFSKSFNGTKELRLKNICFFLRIVFFFFSFYFKGNIFHSMKQVFCFLVFFLIPKRKIFFFP